MGLEEFLNEKNEIDAVKQENEMAIKILEIENQISNYEIQKKELEKEASEFKSKLMNLMIDRGVKSWKTPNKITFTVVEGKEPAKVIEKKLDVESFKEQEPDMYKKFLIEEEKIKNGRKAYLKITLPKE